MREMDQSLDADIFIDCEEKQIIKAYKLSGEAKLEGIIQFVETMLESKCYEIYFMLLI